MKRLITIIAALLLIPIIPNIAIAEEFDWTLISVPASGGYTNPVYFETNTCYASDITVDINNNLYVMSGSRIIRFTPDGHLDELWGNKGIIYDDSIINSNAEQLEIVADSRGYVYAHCRICEDGSPTFIKRYTPDGKVDLSWYADGVMGGKLADYYIQDDDSEPTGGIRNQDEIVLDSKDNLYVLRDREVYRFLPDGTPDSSWKKLKLKQPPSVYDEGGPDTVWFANALRIDRQDNVYIFNGYNQTVSTYDENGQLIKYEKCDLYYPYEYHDETKYLINQVAFDSEGNIYHNDYESNSIFKYSTEFELFSDWSDRGMLSAQNYENQRIDDFVSDTEGNLYLLDKNNAIISKYTNEGNIDVDWCSLGSLGKVNGEGEPMPYVDDIFFDSDGSVYVVNHRYPVTVLYKLNSQYKFIDGWKAEFDDNAEWELGNNSSVLVHAGYVYIEQDNTNVSVREHRIIRLNSDGKQDLDWEIITDGKIYEMICDSYGRLYSIGFNCMINRYTPNGEIDYTWAIKEIPEDGFITGIAMDSNGYLYVCESKYNRITRYTPEGTRDFSWGVGGDIVIPGSGGLYDYFGLLSIAVDDGCNLYISDISNRILRYDSSGKPDTSWCVKGEWTSTDDLLNSLTPLINPTCIRIYEGKLYTVWNDTLYVMSDSLANLGTKNESTPQASAAVTPTVTDNETAAATDENHKMPSWCWVIGAGVLILSLSLILRLTKKSSRN